MKISHFAVAGLVAVGLSHATVHFPFPQNLDYGNANAATLTDKATAATQLQTAFDYYYTTFYRENGDYACIRADPGDNQCFSEGIGYGMLMMVYFSNNEKNYQTEFDKLWALYKAAEDKYGLMNWKIGNADPTQVWGEYAATDAEVDVAAALIMASYQFGDETYLSEAKTLLQNVRSEKSGKKDIIKIEGDVSRLNFDILGYLDPQISITVIENGHITNKIRPQQPKRLVNIIKCTNPRCITAIEQDCDQIFALTPSGRYRCVYCEQEFKVKP